MVVVVMIVFTDLSMPHPAVDAWLVVDNVSAATVQLTEQEYWRDKGDSSGGNDSRKPKGAYSPGET